MTRHQVGVRELRQSLSVYLARVARGEMLDVTDRGRPVARLVPITRNDDIVQQLQWEGRLVAATADLLGVARPRGPVSTRGSRALRRERADRRL